jgi:hypothetical protein
MNSEHRSKFQAVTQRALQGTRLHNVTLVDVKMGPDNG